MRHALFSALLTAAALPGGPAAAAGGPVAEDPKRTEMIDGLVRTVGAQAGIVLHCRALYTLDDTVSDGLSRTVRRTLDTTLGPKRAQAAIDAAGQRIAQEIETAGVAQWCADQRDILNTEGVRVFLD